MVEPADGWSRILFIVLAGILMLGSVSGCRGGRRQTVLPTPAQRLVSLWDAFAQAQTAAHVEAADAQLVSASTQWQGPSEQELLDGTSDWSFVFTSAMDGSVLDVVVRAEEAWVVKQTRVWVPPANLAQGAWKEGPRDALIAFLATGGREFLDERPEAAVDLHLAQGDEGGPVWAVVAVDPGDRNVLSVLVDGETGQVLSASPDHSGR